ncbi:MAG: EamA family transporter [Alphaproteobacteria bacterium]|nr:EamA family transporter [Alphaproteobacteria bacterium]
MAATLSATGAQNARGATHMLAGVFLFSIMDAMVKWLVADYPVHQIVFFRTVFALLPCLYFIARSGGLATLRTKRPLVHAVRGVIGLAAMGCYFYAFALMDLADAKAILFSAPLFMTVLSIPLLGEKVGVFRWSAVLVGFLGVMVIVQPGGDMVQIGALAAIGGAVLYALAVITVRHLSATDSAASITFYFTLTGAAAGTGMVAAFGWVPPSLVDWALLGGVGIIGGVGQYCLTQAFRYAEAAAIAPLEYMSMAWALLLGYLIWSDIPDVEVFAGIALVVASGLFILYRERRLASVRPSRLPKVRVR